jgi:dipeptidyl aminopeptidase/acylaminoacyl peptidase
MQELAMIRTLLSIALGALWFVSLGCGATLPEAPPAGQPPAAPAAGTAADDGGAKPQGTVTPQTSGTTETPTPTQPMDPQPPDGPPQAVAEVPLIPRSVLFGNPDRALVRISRDGTKIAYVAPLDGVLNVWVGPLDDPSAAQPVTHDKGRGIRMYFWAHTNRHIVYRQDEKGDENWHVYAVDIQTKEVRDLTPLEGISAQIEAVSHRFPDEILLGINHRNAELHDVYRVNLLSGERTLVQENEGFYGFSIDDDYRVRLAMRFEEHGGSTYLRRTDEGWQEFIALSSIDAMTSGPAGFDRTGDVLYFIDSRDRNTGALTTIDLKTMQQNVVAENPKADVDDLLTHPTENTLLAVSYTYARKQWQVLDESVQEDFEYLRTVADGELEIPSQSSDNQHWIVAYRMDNGPLRYYHYDRQARQARFLFTNQQALENLPLARMHPVTIRARDGLELVSYLTLPVQYAPQGAARPVRPLPMVLSVHGGPWARDDWGYDPEHQWLANRGYAVLSVNFRGSTGFGKQFMNAAARQWGAAMHDDLLDAVAWAVEEKIADPQRIAIMGASYGGYATLVGLTKTPEVFACGIDIVGPSSLITLMENIPPYWAPFLPVLKDRVGDPTTEEGRQFLLERSPLQHVDRIRRPLLIGQGANDPRVKQQESDQIVQAMQARGIPVVYVLYPDEGHGFARPANRMSFYAVAEAFLKQHLGGDRYEPVGDDFAGSSIQVPVGAEQVPGLLPALQAVQAAP